MKFFAYEQMNLKMKKVAEKFFDENKLKEEMIECYKRYYEADRAGDIHLPAKNENGENITQKCRVQMTTIANYYKYRFEFLFNIVSRIDENSFTWCCDQMKIIEDNYNNKIKEF